jgi:hypothetical protein
MVWSQDMGLMVILFDAFMSVVVEDNLGSAYRWNVDIIDCLPFVGIDIAMIEQLSC